MNKKSFILYCDLIHTVSHLNDEQAGRLLKHILSYVNDENPQSDDVITNLSFEPVKQALKRDLKKYEGYIEKQKANGKKGGRPRKTETQKTQPFLEKPKKADSVNDSDSVNDINNIYNKFVDEVKNNAFDSRIENLYIRLRLKKGSLTPLLKDFKSHIIEENRVHDTTEKFFINFKNWLNMQERIGGLKEYKTKSKGAL